MKLRAAILGSSPLARGLRNRMAGETVHPRIIPARAGFTIASAISTLRSAGSSPLARGLPKSAIRKPFLPRDHPRSRGVYPMVSSPSTADRGSSPLARGLRRYRHRCRHLLRIIPARAGFTRSLASHTPPQRDHPRSRGVYSASITTPGVSVGSSPLARGLRGTGSTARGVGGIIPARAGFTPLPRLSIPLPPDHPRSRGVYTCMSRYCLRRAGSSPLARGLRVSVGVWVNANRIIPARAGFTLYECGEVVGGEDHPRSRGVYYKTELKGRASFGSSPLARGLLS